MKKVKPLAAEIQDSADARGLSIFLYRVCFEAIARLIASL